MTLTTRRRVYWILFGVSSSQLLLGFVYFVSLLGARNPAVFLIEHDIYLVHRFFGLKLPSQILSAADCLFLAGFAVVMGGAILRSFRKTVSPEIFFFSFWLTSLSFEPLRLLHFLLALGGESDVLLGVLDKFCLGVRVFGYLCLFVSGLLAAGMRNDRPFSVVLLTAGISVFLAVSLPVDTGMWTKNLLFRQGYGGLVAGFSAVIILITVANYLVAVRIRGDKAYYAIAAGLAALAIGAYILAQDYAPAPSLAAAGFVIAGGALYVRRLHAFYLWL